FGQWISLFRNQRYQRVDSKFQVDSSDPPGRLPTFLGTIDCESSEVLQVTEQVPSNRPASKRVNPRWILIMFTRPGRSVCPCINKLLDFKMIGWHHHPPLRDQWALPVVWRRHSFLWRSFYSQ